MPSAKVIGGNKINKRLMYREDRLFQIFILSVCILKLFTDFLPVYFLVSFIIFSLSITSLAKFA